MTADRAGAGARLLAAAALALAAGLLRPMTPAGAAPLPAAPSPLPFLHVGGRAGPAALPQVLDSNGRTVLLRGVNVNGLEDYWVDSATPLLTPYPVDSEAYGVGCPARNPAVESMAVCALDFPQLRALGYDSIRLGVSWSLLEPRPGYIEGQYVDRIAQVVSWARDAGIYVVIDMHQDAWSKYVFTPSGQPCPPPFRAVGGQHESDGAPRWASGAVTPTCALNGTRELDTAVQEEFQKLWSDAPGPDGVGLQEHYAAVMAALARRFHADPTVAGYEVMNEPSPGLMPPDVMEATELFPFYGKVVKTVTGAVPGFQQLFFVEPDITRDITDRSFVLTPWSVFSSYPNVVYAPHVYTRVFTPDQALNAPQLAALFPLDGGYRSALGDAAALGLPLWVGEFGNDVPDDGTILRSHYQQADADLIGNSLWVWKADRSAEFSVYHGPFGAGTAFPSRVRFTSRAYPLFTAGALQQVDYGPDTGAFTVRADASAPVPCGSRALATVIFVPDSAAGMVRATNARLELVAVPGGRVVFAYPDRGSYSVYLTPGVGGPLPIPCNIATTTAGVPLSAAGATPNTSSVPSPVLVRIATVATLVTLAALAAARGRRRGGRRGTSQP